MKTIKDIKAALVEKDLSRYFEQLKPHIKNAIHLTLENADNGDIAIGASKMGGLPDLPRNVEWFREETVGIPMTFICQINFAEAKPYDLEDKLPASGILYLFYDYSLDGMPWGFDPNDASGKVAYYYDGDLSGLERKSAPADLDEYGCVFGAAKLSFDTAVELPNPESSVFGSVMPTEDAREKYYELLDEDSGILINKILGHSNNIQGGMELECELVSHGLYCGDSSGYTEGRARGLGKNTGRWTLLLQVDSNEDLGMMWGDCGRLYLWIAEEDLAARNFDASWLILQCG